MTVQASSISELTEDLYTSACEEGDYSACNVFGGMLETGLGIEKDLDRAYELYREACEGGLLQGCTNLGLLYGRGLGSAQDLERARGLYETSCEGGDRLGCDLVGVLAAAAAPGDDDEVVTWRGQVGDGLTRGVLPGAVVEIPELEARAVSNEEGRFAFERLRAGEHAIRIQRFGYREMEATIELPTEKTAVILMDRMELDDPDEPGSIVGLVTDESSDGIADVDVTVLSQPRARAISGRQGRFRLENVVPGLLEVRFTRLGYTPRTATLVVQPGRTAELEVAMPTDAIELEPISVMVRSEFLERSGFYERSRTSGGRGRQFTPQDLEKLKPRFVSDAVRRVPGIRVTDPNKQPVGFHSYAVNPRVQSFDRGDCQLPVYIDGIRMEDHDLNQVDPAHVDALEVYVGGSVPTQYQMMNPCGVVLIWSKR